jgi:hypothetical protein
MFWGLYLLNKVSHNNNNNLHGSCKLKLNPGMCGASNFMSHLIRKIARENN